MSGGERPNSVNASAIQGIQVGNDNTQNNYFYGEFAAGPGVGAPGTVVSGDIPQEPTAFQPRAGLMAALGIQSGARVRVVYAVTGIRGVGKTQAAAAYARRRISDSWRLVAWVDASAEASLLAGLAQVATAAGVGPAGEDPRSRAARVRPWLEADGERRLLVFDNATDLDMLRPFLPAAGAGQVIITSTRQSVAGLGVPVPVGMFTGDEALAFLAERTGLEDAAGARELAKEMGFLPLGLAQAAALIARERLSYGTYLERLRSLPVASYVRRVDGDAYPYRLAEAIELSLRALEASDPSGVCGRLMELVAVLAEAGVPRRLLHLAAGTGVLGTDLAGAAEVDGAVGDLVDAPLVGFTVDGESVAAHLLVMRVARERLAEVGALSDVVAAAVQLLAGAADGITEAWRDPVEVRELAGQVSAITACLAPHPGMFVEVLPGGLLELRLRVAYLLNALGDSTGLAISVAEPLTADVERLLGPDHTTTLASRDNLASAYRDARRTAEAVSLFERTLADRERLLGADHPDTLASRNNLAMAYQSARRTAEAITAYERTLADAERLLGPDHPSTIRARANLSALKAEANAQQ